MTMRFAITGLLALFAQLAMAETVYIRDTLYVPLRGGQGQEYRILHKGIKSGTPLELIKENEETGYSLVRMEDGLEGWIQTQYLQKEPIAADLLADAESRVTDLEAKYQKSLLRIQELETANDKLASTNENLQSKTQQLSDQLDKVKEMSADTIAINRENAELKNENRSLQDRIDALNEDNEALQDHSYQQWFLRGAGVVFLGLLFGFWVARRIYHQRGGGWWT